jgi:division protein CdvB (Snf7/Vps24/ESCRT-III family)
VEFSLSDAARILGALAAIERIESKIDTLGVLVATAKQQLDELKAQLADTTADVLAKLDQLTQQLGTLDPDAQATLDEIKAGVQQLDDAVGDADGSDTPPVEPTSPNA